MKHTIFNKNYNIENNKCPFCDKQAKNLQGLSRHIRICKLNPEMDMNFYKTQYLNYIPWNKNSTTLTDKRIDKSRLTLKESYRTGKVIHRLKNKHISDEQREKISISLKRFYDEHPDVLPYGLLQNRISVPEQYFIKVFNDENIPLKFHLKVKRYQLDFYNEELKKYVEIDGEQHYTESGIKHDIERTEFLSNLGWEGKRIRWSKFISSSKEEQNLMIDEIKDFIQ